MSRSIIVRKENRDFFLKQRRVIVSEGHPHGRQTLELYFKHYQEKQLLRNLLSLKI